MDGVTNLSAQWQQHADDNLPIDAAQATVVHAKREWYYEQLLRLKDAPKTAQNAALLAEALGFGSTIGREVERA